MKLLTRTLLILGTAIAVLVLSLEYLFSYLLMDGFLKTETATTETQIRRTTELINNIGETLASKISDWARWDDAFQFMRDKNKDFIESNLSPSAAAGLHVHHFLFFDAQQKLFYGKSYDLEQEQERPLFKELITFFEQHAHLLRLEEHAKPRHWILSSQIGPILVAVAPIVPTNDDKPARGTLVFAKEIGKYDTEYLSKLMQLPVTLYDISRLPPNDPLRSLLTSMPPSHVLTHTKSRDLIEGYGVVHNVLNEPAILFRIDCPRTVYMQALKTQNSVIMALLVAGMVMGGIIIIILERLVLRRIRDLSEEVSIITESRDPSARVQQKGKDELYTLAKDINSMLEVIEKIRSDLQRATEVAESANKTKSAFVANISHEIRTPLNGILGITQLIQGMPLSPELKEYIQTISDSGDALLQMINEVLDFSKIEARKLSLDPTPCALVDLATGVANTLALKAYEKGIELIVEMDPHLPEEALVDELRLRQVLLNLIGNAIKFTEKGEVILRLSMKQKDREHAQIEFAVRDSGIGIPKEKQQSIFGAFSQADASTTRKYGGTGLGLTISRSLVELMGGALIIESTPGKGATFSFILTLNVQHATIAQRFAGSLSSTTCAVPLVIISENHRERSSLTSFLSTIGFTSVSHYASLSEMPEVPPSALYLIEYNQRTLLPHCINQKIILLPLHRLREISSLQAEGFSHHIKKPVHPYHLLCSILTVLQQPLPILPHASKETQQVLIPREKARILVVDDVATNRKVLRLLLERWGHTVEEASSGEQVIALLERIHYFEGSHAYNKDDFDIILMDMQMPQMNGLETTQTIRARSQEEHASRYHIPILAVTANVLKEDVEQCILAGMEGVLTKPIKAPTLFAAIERTLSPTLSTEEIQLPVPTNTPTRETSLISLDALTAEFGDDHTILMEILSEFRDELPALIQALTLSLSQQDCSAMARAAHALKGSLANGGAWQARAYAETLEELARNNALSPSLEAGRTLESHAKKVAEEIHEVLAKLSCS